jgi:hypothetical protein
VGGQDFAGSQFDDGDAGLVGDREDFLAAVGGADAEVVHAAGAAEGHLAFGVEPVVAQAVVALGVAVGGGDGFGGGSVGVAGSAPAQGAVGAVLVVVLAEGVEVALQLGDVRGWWSGSEPALQGLVEAFGLALGLGVAGGSVRLADAEDRKDVFEGVAASGEAGGVDAAVVRG